MTPDEHRARHKLLHDGLDELLADYLTCNRGKMPSTMTLMELLKWSHQQTIEPQTEPTGNLMDITKTPVEETAVRLAKLAVAFGKAHAVYFPSSGHEMADLGVAYLLGVGIDYWISPFGDAITCVKCRNTSYNANDVQNLYCGFCHVFHPPAK